MNSNKSIIKISAAGDILITRRIPKGNTGIEAIGKFIKQGDIRVANLETTVTDGSCFASAFSGGTWLTTTKECLEDIKNYGFNMLALSNNHSMDYSYDGLAMTRKYVEKAGFYNAGTGENLYEASRAAVMETASGRVGIINICSTCEDAARAGIQTSFQKGRPGQNALRFQTVYRVTKEHANALLEIGETTKINGLRQKHREQGFINPLPEGRFEFGTSLFEIVETKEEEGRFSTVNNNDMERTIRGIKEALFSCEAVIVMVHSHEIKDCEEYEPDFFLEEFAHKCIDAGACAVIGSGTHQIKGIEFYKDCPIFYCLGNFIFENEYVRVLPADYMEKYALSYDATAAEGIEERKKQSKHSLYSVKEVYETILPYFEVENGKCTHIELMPVTLGFDRVRYEKNLPYPASKEEALEILDYLNHACEPYNVKWGYENERFVCIYRET
ncbi:MAG: CapA family protein [Lachnospira sp.]